MVIAPSFCASASVAGWPPLSTKKRLEKSRPPVSQPSGGVMTSLTSELTMEVKDAPTTTPTARSTTLPRMANFRNSSNIDPLSAKTLVRRAPCNKQTQDGVGAEAGQPAEGHADGVGDLVMDIGIAAGEPLQNLQRSAQGDQSECRPDGAPAGAQSNRGEARQPEISQEMLKLIPDIEADARRQLAPHNDRQGREKQPGGKGWKKAGDALDHGAILPDRGSADQVLPSGRLPV